MAIHIIGAKPEDEGPALPEPDVRLPGPESAPAARRLVSAERIRELLARPEPLLRAFAMEQLSAYPEKELHAEVIRAITDPDPFVFSEALSVAAEEEVPGAAEVIESAFADADGDRAAALGTTLGRLAPERLLAAVKARRRLDDDAYPSVATALAVVGGDEIRRFFEKALGRSAMMAPDRRRALFTAVLVSGDPALCRRVLGEAIGDSNAEAPEGQSFPSRVAVASLGGLPDGASRLEAGDEVYERSREVLEEDAAPVLDEAHRKALVDALGARRVGDALRALTPLVELELRTDPEIEAELGSLPRRRQGLLGALVARAKDIEKLELAASSIFLTAAAQAASLVATGGASEATSAAAEGLGKALEVEPETLVAEDSAALSARFEAISPREMRRVHTLLASQAFRRSATFDRFVSAVFRAGHGAGFVAAAAESKGEVMQRLALDALAEVPEDAETALLEVLDERPLEPAAARFALVAAERLRTERLGLAIGRRFLELRKLDKGAVARALLHVADERLLPLLESRAFPNEPEETAWAVLSLVLDRPEEGRLAEALERSRANREGRPRGPLEVELACERCGEVGAYAFSRAFVDTEAMEEQHGDPAFVGDVGCKACGAQDSLRATATTGRILASHMLRFLDAMQSGQAQGGGLVQPGQIAVQGKRMGLARALRELNELVEASPENIRLRLERARLLMVLDRPSLHEDLARLRELDPDAVEASVLEASHAARHGERAAAAALLVAAHERLGAEPAPRVYDSDSADSLRAELEELLLELAEKGETVPKSIDLAGARARRSARREREDAHDAELAARAAAEGPPSRR